MPSKNILAGKISITDAECQREKQKSKNPTSDYLK